MPRDQERATVPVADPSRWLARWCARQWTAWRLEVVLEATLWAFAVGTLVKVSACRVAWALAAAGAVLLGRTLAGGLVRDVRTMLRALERREPALANALLTWHEVESGSLVTSPAFAQRLAEQSQAVLHATTRPRPRHRWQWISALACLACAAAVMWLAPSWPARTDTGVRVPARRADAPVTGHPAITVRIVVTPPSYTGRPASEPAIDAPLIDALTGSRLHVRYEGLPPSATARMGTQPLALTPVPGADASTGAASFEVDVSGLLTVHDVAGRAVATTAIHAVADMPPVVRIVQPGQDLRVTDPASTLPVLVTATDDIGLRTLRLRYTKVSGSGESFTFTDGEAPLITTRASATSWEGGTTLDLGALAMAPGDSLVYYAVARDGRLDEAGLAESERYLIEIPRPGALAAGDFSLPEPEQRYALSQRMVIQLTEGLLERRTRMTPEAYASEAQALAIQQRRVRAEFVFMMGGDVVDEVEEAEHSHEIEAGRLDNSGQQELLEAVRQMSQAEERLTAASLEQALPYEYRALNALQAAFGRARYFMRTLPTTVAIDLARRGSGDLDRAAASTWTRAPLPADALARARQVLGQLSTLASVSDVSAVHTVADAVIALDPESAEWLGVVQRLVHAFAAGQTLDDRSHALDTVADAVRARLQATSPSAMDLRLPLSGDEARLSEGVRTP